MQTWSIPLQVFALLKQELHGIAPVEYMKHIHEINYDAECEIYRLTGAKDCTYEDAISQVFIKHRPGTSEYLLKYMPTVQYGRMWNAFYRQCRGTVIDMDKMRAWHSYSKFFNVFEVPENDENVLLQKAESTQYTVMNKWDGSLVMFYHNNNEWRTCTNGSFESEQAVWALDYARDIGLLDSLLPTHTHMFEAIYPDNRIVVNYGDTEALIPLAYRDMTTGKLFFRGGRGMDEYMTFRDCLDSRDKFGATEKEGWVIAFDDGHLVKVKCTDYVTVHRLKEHITPEGVFDMIRDDTLDDVRSAVPDDIRAEIDDIVRRYVDWERELRRKVESIEIMPEAGAPTWLKWTYFSVRDVFPDGTFEQWYALRCIRGQIDTQQSPLAYVTTFSKVEHIFEEVKQ